jgi:hypothetical protein
VFGMGTGVTLLLWPPGNLVSGVPRRLNMRARAGRPRSSYDRVRRHGVNILQSTVL